MRMNSTSIPLQDAGPGFWWRWRGVVSGFFVEELRRAARSAPAAALHPCVVAPCGSWVCCTAIMRSSTGPRRVVSSTMAK